MCSLQKIAKSEQRVDCRPRPACGLLATQPSNHRGHASPDSRCSVVRVGECVCEMHSAYARTHTQQQHMQPRRPPGRTPQSLHDGLGGAGTTKPCLGLPAAAAGPPLIPSTNICGPPLFFPPPPDVDRAKPETTSAITPSSAPLDNASRRAPPQANQVRPDKWHPCTHWAGGWAVHGQGARERRGENNHTHREGLGEKKRLACRVAEENTCCSLHTDRPTSALSRTSRCETARENDKDSIHTHAHTPGIDL